MISNCGKDENNNLRGGKAGDQTGHEWELRSWYSRPWTVVLRPPKKAASTIARLATDAAKNNMIGYDQDQRTTFYTQLSKVGWEPKKIKVKCESDCSAGVSAIVIATGHLLNMKSLENVSKDNTTSTLKSALKNAGFEVITKEKYLTSDKYLKKGDVLLYPGHHTAINVTDGSEIKKTETLKSKTLNKTVKKVLKCTASSLSCRTWAGVEYPTCTKKPSYRKDEKIQVCDEMNDSKGNKWYYVKSEFGSYGFVSSKYCK